MLTLNEKNETIVPDGDETESLNKIKSLLVALAKAKETDQALKMIGTDGEEVVLTASVVQALQQIVHLLAQGKSIAVTPVERELTTLEAADYLSVPERYIVKLLEDGEIPFRLVGTEHHIRQDDMVEYKKLYKERQAEALADLAQISQEWEFYE